ncbi:MAG: flagellar filament capping protein FliD [Selenomonadaceae bacterium]|nr:flagellar filament capping protein FliD [Selenomonadaceae bacterium]
MGVNGIYGLSGSGLDIESMVKVGMISKQKQYDRMYQNEVKQEWLKEAYSEVYSKLNTFTNTTMFNYKMSATTNAMSAATSNSTTATATANADAAAMTHSVKVNSLASNAYLLTGDEGITRSGETTTGKSIYLKDVIDISGMGDDETLSFDISDGTNTATISFTKDELSRQTLNDFAVAIKNAKDPNTESAVNIKATFDAANDSMSLYNSASGSANIISLKANDSYAASLLNNLNLHQVTKNDDGETVLSDDAYDFSADASGDYTAQVASGSDASVTIDGKSYTTDTGKISVANVTYSLAAVGSTTVTVTQDTDKIIENVKQFVEDYNELLGMLNDKYNEKQYSDYKVLTKAQEEAMTEEQIKKWNEKAKSGLLYHNSDIAELRSSLREAVYTSVTSVDGKYKTMSSIGIESRTDQGILRLDEDKLRAALTDDPDCVYQLFVGDATAEDSIDKNLTGVSKTAATKTAYAATGVINRITSAGNKSMTAIKDYAGTSTEAADGSTLGDLIIQLQNKMSSFKTMMSAYESLLFKKYDAMEVTLARLGTQMNMFGFGST